MGLPEMRYRLPASVNLRIIGKCNLACPFCYGPFHSLPAINVGKLLNLIALFPQLGVRRVVITGGEPLLVPELVEILHELKRQNIGVLISTNGTLLDDRYGRVYSMIDWLALPLDADDPLVNSRMRPGHVNALNHNDIQPLISYLRSDYPGLRIRLGTVVCLINRHNITGIPDLISNQFKPDVWKLYQFTSSSYGLLNQKRLEIPEDEFEHITALAKEKAARFNIHVDVYRPITRDRMYFFLEPNGDAMIVLEGKENVIGNCFEDLDKVLRVCSEHLDFEEIEIQTRARS